MDEAWTWRLGEHLPAIFPEQTAAWRLLSNEEVRMEHILASHCEQTVERCRAERLVLAVQDTTTLNGLSATSDLDDIGGGGKGLSTEHCSLEATDAVYGSMRIGLRHHGGETVDWLKARLGAGDCTRTSLARELCECEDWRNAKGELCLASARAELPKFSAALGLPLPEARPMGGVTPESLAPSPDYPHRHLSCRLDDLGEISVVPVADEDKSLARSMMAWHHPEAGTIFVEFFQVDRFTGAPKGIVAIDLANDSMLQPSVTS